MYTDLEKLKAAWLHYKNLHKTSQTAVSEELGWASATLGLYLSGRRKIKTQHAVQLANLFDVPVTRVLPDLELSVVREVNITATASGNEPMQDVKKIKQTSGLIGIFCDIPIYIDGAALAVPKGVTLIVSEHEAHSWDERWPPMEPKYWVVQSKNKVKMVMSATRPKRRRGETVYHLQQALFI